MCSSCLQINCYKVTIIFREMKERKAQIAKSGQHDRRCKDIDREVTSSELIRSVRLTVGIRNPDKTRLRPCWLSSCGGPKQCGEQLFYRQNIFKKNSK